MFKRQKFKYMDKVIRTMVYLVTTEAEIQQKMGANHNVAFNTTMMEAAEIRHFSTVIVLCRENWKDDTPTAVEIKGILSDVVSSLVAIEGIAYDMSGFTSRIEAEDMINVLRDGALRGLAILRDKKNQDFVKEHAT